MSSFQKAVLAAIVKSLLRGKSLLQAILSYWAKPLAIDKPKKSQITSSTFAKSIEEFLKEAEAELLDPINPNKLKVFSEGLGKQFLERLMNDPECMLPSYNHQLPSGNESGRYLALDVGGSTLRVALVELSGRSEGQAQSSNILSMQNFKIGKEVKDLEGTLFFDWMAERILETLSSEGLHESQGADKPLPVAIAWSFPIEQTSLGGGKLQAMGKGFMAHKTLLGSDLGVAVKDACQNQGINVEVAAILNDSTACLLSEAYHQTSTRFGLILGTGVNVAAYLPVSLISRKKFGDRPAAWFDSASHVIVNTELGMFGHNILPVTRWDQKLSAEHPRPDFQPLEHMVSGMYLGEVARFALIEAIETTGIFGGIVPPSLANSYALGTDTLSMIESDTTEDLINARQLFSDRHPSPHNPTISDLSALRTIASFISRRSSALVATCVYTLWHVRLESHRNYTDSLSKESPLYQDAVADLKLDQTVVGFNGSVIEQYPGYLASCQHYLNELLSDTNQQEKGGMNLVPAKESSLLGTAVASACVQNSS